MPRKNQPSAKPVQKPIHVSELGVIKAAIWENANSNGVFYKIKVEKSYPAGDSWMSSTNYDRNELPLLIEVVQMAQSWINQRALQLNGQATVNSLWQA